MSWFDYDDNFNYNNNNSNITTIFCVMNICSWNRGNVEIRLITMDWPKSFYNCESYHLQFFEGGQFHSMFHLNFFPPDFKGMLSRLPDSHADLLRSIVEANAGLEDFGNNVPSFQMEFLARKIAAIVPEMPAKKRPIQPI